MKRHKGKIIGFMIGLTLGVISGYLFNFSILIALGYHPCVGPYCLLSPEESRAITLIFISVSLIGALIGLIIGWIIDIKKPKAQMSNEI